MRSPAAIFVTLGYSALSANPICLCLAAKLFPSPRSIRCEGLRAHIPGCEIRGTHGTAVERSGRIEHLADRVFIAGLSPRLGTICASAER
jgi:hypothetical protein